MQAFEEFKIKSLKFKKSIKMTKVVEKYLL